VLDYGASTADASADAAARVTKVAVPGALRPRLAARAGVSAAQASSFSRLPLPLAVSGLSQRGRDRLQAGLDRAGIPALVTASSAAVRPTGASTFAQPRPGGNFAGVLSYGDLSAAGIGTTTYVCNDDVLAFGHPLTFGGPSAFGANDANAITIVTDPTLTPFKLANVKGLFGTLDQDRLAAVRSVLGDRPSLIPVRSTVTVAELGRTRNGRSDVTMSQFVPDIAAFHMLGNIDTVFDEIGAGTSQLEWSARGHRANGAPFVYTRSNRYASRFDISVESIFELFNHLAIIEGNPYTAITFDRVDVDASVDDTYRAYSIAGMTISRNGGPFRDRDLYRINPGDDLVIRVALQAFRGDLRNVDVPFEVPANASSGGGFLQVLGGSGFDEGALSCLFDHDACAQGAGGGSDSFAELISALENAPKNNDLRAVLFLFSEEGGESITQTTRRVNQVVTGSDEVEVFIP
jgi:hypothetical protein